jgi:hypothetical protein
MKNWLSYFFTHHWKNYVASLNSNISNLLTFEENFVAEFYPDPPVNLPEYLISISNTNSKCHEYQKKHDIEQQTNNIPFPIQLLGSNSI